MARQTELWTKEMAVGFRGLDKGSLPRCVFNPTLIRYMGDVEGKSVLDIGCGEGQFCRLIKSKAASRVMGVDISPMMISFAKEDDEKANIHCEYQLGDARQLGKISEFDVVTITNVLQFANTIEDLTNMCRGFYQNLKPGGLFYGIAINVYENLKSENTFEKYANVTFNFMPKEGESTPVKIVGAVGDDGRPPITVTLYLFEPEEYEKAFLTAGFRSVEHRPVIVDENLIPEYPDGFWDLYLEKPTHICYIATK